MSGRSGRRRAAYRQRREGKGFDPYQRVRSRPRGDVVPSRGDCAHEPYQTEAGLLCRLCWAELDE